MDNITRRPVRELKMTVRIINDYSVYIHIVAGNRL